MRINFDKKADAVYIRFSEEKYFESDEIREGFIVDYDNKGRIIGIEILDVSKNLPVPATEEVMVTGARALQA